MISSLKNQKEFDIVNKYGEKHYLQYFIAVASVNNIFLENKSAMTLGMKVSRKVGKAVTRNKIRRRIRHLTRLISKSLQDIKIALIIIPKKSFERIEFTKLLTEFNKIPSIYGKK